MKEALDAVRELNSSIGEHANILDSSCLFSLETNGYDFVVEIFGTVIYSSEDSYLEFNEETNSYEPIKQFLIDRYNELVCTIKAVNL